MVKNLPTMQETGVWSLDRENPLEKGMATHSSILAWRNQWTEGLVGYSPWGHTELDMTEWLTLSLRPLPIPLVILLNKTFSTFSLRMMSIQINWQSLLPLLLLYAIWVRHSLHVPAPATDVKFHVSGCPTLRRSCCPFRTGNRKRSLARRRELDHWWNIFMR